MNQINQIILPKELLQVIENDELEWDGGALITSIDYFEDHVKIELSILLDRSDEKQQFWEIQLEGLRSQRILREWSENIDVFDQHFLIDEQTDKHVELYIKSKANDSNKLLSDLYFHFSREYDGLISFDKYVNASLIQMNFGLLARGPKFIMDRIKHILTINGCSPYFYENNSIEIEDKPNLYVLFIGSSYFIAEKITFERV
jgi:hypothetical protein